MLPIKIMKFLGSVHKPGRNKPIPLITLNSHTVACTYYFSLNMSKIPWRDECLKSKKIKYKMSWENYLIPHIRDSWVHGRGKENKWNKCGEHFPDQKSKKRIALSKRIITISHWNISNMVNVSEREENGGKRWRERGRRDYWDQCTTL